MSNNNPLRTNSIIIIIIIITHGSKQHTINIDSGGEEGTRARFYI